MSPLVADCGTGTLCRRVADATGHEWAGQLATYLVAKPLTILLILLGALVARVLVHRSIDRLAAGAAAGTVPGVLVRGPSRLLADSPLLSERRQQRAATMASVLHSVTTGVVLAVAFVMVLAELGLNIAPVIASAGIVGVALGFGAQTLVKDFLSGLFMILEDQYGVGDVVDLGEATGTVEAVGLRVTRVRGFDGVVWYVRNGEVLRVGNRSQGWSVAVLDVTVALGPELGRVQDLMRASARELAEDPQWRDKVAGAPEVTVESVTGDAVTLRVSVRCTASEHERMRRELHRRLLAAFDRAGVRPGVDHVG